MSGSNPSRRVALFALPAAAMGFPAMTQAAPIRNAGAERKPVTQRQLRELRRFAAYIAGRKSLKLHEAWKVQQRALDGIGVDHLRDIPSDRFRQAMKMLHGYLESG